MTKEDILKAMVERAKERGDNIGDIQSCTIWFIVKLDRPNGHTVALAVDHTYAKPDVTPSYKRFGKIYYFSLSDLLFSHDFMRALCKGLSVCAGVRTILCHEKQSKACNKDLEHGNCDYKSKKETAIFIVKRLAELPTDAARLEYVKNNILEVTK